MIRQVRKKSNFSNYLKTKIVATIGPSSSDEKILSRMVRNGMSVARLNFSHGSHEDHAQTIRLLRKVTSEEDQPVTILQDLCGPKIRLCKMDEPVVLKRGKLVKLSVNHDLEAELYTDFKDIPKLVKPDNAILLDDGYIELTVVETAEDYVICRVKVPGTAKSRKGINLPDVTTSIPVFTEKDRKDFIFGLSQNVDMAALSFVERPEDIEPLREIMKKKGRIIPIIAKIERPVALNNIEGIIREFDGIMIARGDLGVELPLEEVPIFQKKLIQLADQKNKYIITATQMLESMTGNPRPTRAEASDVSNAILDGTDAVMLSGETAAGQYPVKAVNVMKRIALITENSKLYNYCLERDKGKYSASESIVKSAAEIAGDLKAKYIMVYTISGRTALLLSRYRPQCPILAFTPSIDVVQRMAAYWGVSAHYIEPTKDTDEMILRGENHMKQEHGLKSGDLVVTVAGMTRMKGATNMLRVSKIS